LCKGFIGFYQSFGKCWLSQVKHITLPLVRTITLTLLYKINDEDKLIRKKAIIKHTGW